MADLKATLEGLGTEVATKVGVKANRDAAKEFQDHLAQTAPHDAIESKGNRRYGTLRENIKLRRQKAQKQGHIIHIVSIGRAFWGFFQEFGTVNMAARPWMRPAIEAWNDALVDVQLKRLREGIEATVKRLARNRRKG
ncbi:HK97-gp10 family putative phage morphogenesis protein [Sphingobium sp. 3R8]|uniref:HK97-gp10 family putative phage morphogenesis protein n=1 Tax=Sphingobium sp. 3R8 TaxID=2874921 RepID=UPI0021E29035|nr:HK97-gp10 family putative phage morphogenesis protein [Sphingobium sp. 3R8]